MRNLQLAPSLFPMKSCATVVGVSDFCPKNLRRCCLLKSTKRFIDENFTKIYPVVRQWYSNPKSAGNPPSTRRREFPCKYSKASRYTASSCTDLDNARFWIGSKKIWDARIYVVRTFRYTNFWDARFFFSYTNIILLLTKKIKPFICNFYSST